MSVEIQKLFFELVQVAIGNRKDLSRVPTAGEWSAIYDESERQAITGIMVVGLERLKNLDLNFDDNHNYTADLDQLLLLQWIGIGEQIKQGNLQLNKCCKQLQRQFGEAGLQSSILKGQGILTYYDEPLRELRQSGDIDIYVDCGFKKALRKVESLGIRVESWDYKHAHLKIWDDVEVEMHYRVEVLLNLWKNRKLQKWFKNHENDIWGTSKDSECSNKSRIGELENKASSNTDSTDGKANTNLTNSTNYYLNGIITPTVEFNVFYILLHIYRHFLYEGVGMRQIMDYYFVLVKVKGERLKVKEYVDAVREFGMTKFAKGLMWVMQEALGMPREWMLWEPDAKEGQYILDEVMAGGNFGHYDQRLMRGKGKWNTVKQVCRHNWHIMSHYPADVVWAPVWFMWHKCWKLFHS
jgi:hypothetical protein